MIVGERLSVDPGLVHLADGCTRHKIGSAAESLENLEQGGGFAERSGEAEEVVKGQDQC